MNSSRRGGLVQDHAVRLDGGGGVVVTEVWHWRWYSLRCNWMNRHRHGWKIITKRNRGLRQHVVMANYWPPSTRTPSRV